MNKKRIFWIGTAGICALLLTGAIWTKASLAEKGSALVAKGTVEGTEVDLNSKIPGRVLELLVSEGDQVQVGQLIAKISDEELKAKEAQAKALVDAAQQQVKQAEAAAKLQEQLNNSNLARAKGAEAAALAQLAKAQQGARNQEILQAQASYDLWNKTYQRVARLFQQGAVPAQKLDEVKTQLEVAKQTLSIAKEGARKEDIRTAQALVEQAQAGVAAANAGLLQNKIAQDQLLAAQAKYQQAIGGLQEVQAYLKDTVLKAPIAGTITALNVDPGELVSSGMAIATITDTNHLWVEVKIKESELAQVKLNQAVQVELATNSAVPLSGKVTRIAKKPDFATKRATNDKGEIDILAYGVKVQISNPNNLPAVGMTATVAFTRGESER